MTHKVQNIVVGQGLAGSVLAWTLHQAGQSFVVVDREDNVTASKVAAGLITPLTGKRLVKSPVFDQQWDVATRFYRYVEEQTQEALFDAADMIRVFNGKAHEAEFIASNESGDDSNRFERWQERLQIDGPELSGFRMSPAGRLNVRKFLAVTRAFFVNRESYQHADLDLERDVIFEDGRVLLDRPGISAERLILCQGVAKSHFFPSVPNNPSRGDILKVQIGGYTQQKVVHRSIWIAANDDGTQTVGATYDWKNLTNEPTATGRTEILGQLSRLVSDPVLVKEHMAAVRPTMKDYQPVVGQHPEISDLFILNGLGSKGTLRAPAMAEVILNLINGSGNPPTEVQPERLVAKAQASSDSGNQQLTSQAQLLVQAVLEPGDTAVDATVGNGFDTCFLAKAVGDSGRVIGFDIQPCAIESTKRRLQAGELNNVILRQETHEHISDLAADSVSAVMFNLGFLPRSDHSVITRPASSTAALESAMKCLKPNGILTVLSYRGHDGGQNEFQAVERLLCGYADRYDLQRIDSTPPKKNSPVLFVLTKSDGDDDAK